MKITIGIAERLRFIANRLRERLWIKPLVICLISIAGVFVAKAADQTGLRQIAPEISVGSVATLLTIMASSMLVIATFAVGSMVSAYASTSSTATPRSFRLVVSDDLSQNSLSTFVGAFIFSIVALTTVENDYFQTAGRFTLFVLTLIVLALVIITFVRWVDRIARLGRLGTTIDKVEAAAAAALKRRRTAPTLQGVTARQPLKDAWSVYSPAVGYVQRIDISVIQDFAARVHGRVAVAALPGTFVSPGRPLAYVRCEDPEFDDQQVIRAFVIGGERLFDDDPRFGLVVLSEIAGRALSPAVNDPGTAIDIIGTMVRLFTNWITPEETESSKKLVFDRVEVPELLARDMFDDAFTAIARDGAGILEVAVRLQKAFNSLAFLKDEAIREAAIHHSRLALARSEKALKLPEEIDVVRNLARFE